MKGRQPKTRSRGAGPNLGSPHRIACVPIKIIRALTTGVRQNPATARIIETDRSWFVAQKVSAERGTADTIIETGQSSPSSSPFFFSSSSSPPVVVAAAAVPSSPSRRRGGGGVAASSAAAAAEQLVVVVAYPPALLPSAAAAAVPAVPVHRHGHGDDEQHTRRSAPSHEHRQPLARSVAAAAGALHTVDAAVRQARSDVTTELQHHQLRTWASLHRSFRSGSCTAVPSRAGWR